MIWVSNESVEVSESKPSANKRFYQKTPTTNRYQRDNYSVGSESIHSIVFTICKFINFSLEYRRKAKEKDKKRTIRLIYQVFHIKDAIEKSLSPQHSFFKNNQSNLICGLSSPCTYCSRKSSKQSSSCSSSANRNPCSVTC